MPTSTVSHAATAASKANILPKTAQQWISPNTANAETFHLIEIRLLAKLYTVDTQKRQNQETSEQEIPKGISHKDLKEKFQNLQRKHLLETTSQKQSGV
jgi:hypothetical protein